PRILLSPRFVFFSYASRHPPFYALFPYTTLFRSRENIRESPRIRVRGAGSSVFGPAMSGRVGRQFEIDNRRLRAGAERPGGDVEFARVLAGDDDREQVLGIP